MGDRFENWQYPEIEEGKPTKYNWVVQNKGGLRLGYRTDIGGFTYIKGAAGRYVASLIMLFGWGETEGGYTPPSPPKD